MRHKALAAMLLILLALTVGCVDQADLQQNSLEFDRSANRDPNAQSKEWQRRQELSNTIIYFRDDRTNLCYAYLWAETRLGQSSVGGPGLANVPCEAVNELLIPNPAALATH